MDNLIPIGRFSRVSRLSIKALRHYDDAGLLTPAWVDPSSGYRYYSYAQANRAEAIRMLRSLDMPLDEIRTVLEAPDHLTAARVYERHGRRLQEQLDRHTRMLSFLRRLVTQEVDPMSYDITLKQLPAQHTAVLRQQVTAATIGPSVGQGFATIAAAIERCGAGFAGPPFLIMTEPVDAESAGEIELGFPVASPFPSDGQVLGQEEPARMVAATVHQGPYDEAGPAYAAVEAWIQEHGHAGAGAPREVYLNSPDQVPPPEYLTEIQFPISLPV
ncbi:MAG: GyrI-like domain-containing protein [Propionicimonas sp.]|uniref:MerR family transcriptional regulator n=1 Tax=Propionicimonas sp. TaxID=1955623 RepID=UPI002B1F9BC4|nr:GyrI-like domain-containing protein [Propionicimonas sp.]MEA4944409.1 GyrI-like domain-containing protein [Propionicimonas sp.]MEA5054123.1 GyrI-like domain-containing protein [Propionicimonas sp.]